MYFKILAIAVSDQTDARVCAAGSNVQRCDKILHERLNLPFEVALIDTSGVIEYENDVNRARLYNRVIYARNTTRCA